MHKQHCQLHQQSLGLHFTPYYVPDQALEMQVEALEMHVKTLEMLSQTLEILVKTLGMLSQTLEMHVKTLELHLQSFVKKVKNSNMDKKAYLLMEYRMYLNDDAKMIKKIHA